MIKAVICFAFIGAAFATHPFYNGKVGNLTEELKPLYEGMGGNFDGMSKELGAANQQMLDLTSQAVQLFNYANEQKKSLEEYKFNIFTCIKKTRELQGDLIAAKKQLGNQSSTISNLEGTLTTVQAELVKKSAAISALGTELHDVKAQLESKLTVISSLETENQDLKNENGDMVVQLETANATNAKLHMNLLALRGELTAAQKDLDQRGIVLARLTAELDKTKSDLDTKTRKIATLEADLEKANAESDSLTTQILNLEAEKLLMTVELNRLKEVNNRLEKGYKVVSGRYVKYMYYERANWQNARKMCQEHYPGGDLVVVKDKEMNSYLAQFPVSWIGGTDEGHEGKWTWITGEEITETNWMRGQPDNGGKYGRWGSKKENCLSINFVKWGSSKGKWNDAPCSTEYHFTCELPPMN